MLVSAHVNPVACVGYGTRYIPWAVMIGIFGTAFFEGKVLA